MKKIVYLFIFSMAVNYCFSLEFSINNLFGIDIPEEMEVVSVYQGLGVKNDNSQYYIRTEINIIYGNKYFTISIRCFGDTNTAILGGTETYNMRKRTYYGDYDTGSQIRYLKQNFINDIITNKNGIQFSRFAGEWSSGRTSDYYGLFFLLQNNDLNECTISINNIWGAFTVNVHQKLTVNDKNYKSKALAEGEELYSFIQLLDKIEESINFTSSKGIINITPDYSYEKYYTDYAIVLPSINNLRMRNIPSLTGEVLGYMENQLYETIIIGDEVEIDGIKGNWIMIKPLFKNSLSWVFSGYTQKATEEEIFRMTEGS